MSLEKFKDGIQKTGFVLENNISQTLKIQGWSVITNKYYEDDFEDKIREIDLIAYKTKKVKDFDVYTCLIISCKKSELNAWALLSRDLNQKDPNIDLRPLHSWSNQPSIKYQLSLSGKAHEYYDDIRELGVKDALADPTVDIFAFQEMNKTTGKAENQKAIYNSIISLIKAQSYEMSALLERKKTPSVYQFNLLSIIDSEIIRLHFEDNKITPISTTSEHHISRYIINGKQSFSKIRFIESSTFEKILPDYNKLHKANLQWYEKTCNSFYKEIEKDQKRLKVYIEAFTKEIRKTIFSRTYDLLKRSVPLEGISLYWMETKDSLMIGLSTKDHIQDVVSILNTDEEAKEKVAAALKKIYRYTGSFYFEEDIPF